MDLRLRLRKKDVVSGGVCGMEAEPKVDDVELLGLSVMEYNRQAGLLKRELGHMRLIGGQVGGWWLGVGPDRHDR